MKKRDELYRILSPLGIAITGEVLHVDNGYNKIAMLNMDNAKETAQMASLTLSLISTVLITCPLNPLLSIAK